MSTNEITSKIHRLKKLQTKAADIEAEIKAIQDELKSELIAADVDEMNAGIFRISYKEIVSNRFDSKAFKATHADLYKQYTKQTSSRRFIVA